MTVNELWNAFDAYNVRHKSPKTVKFYRSRLRLFLAKFGDRPFAPREPDDPPETGISPLDIDEFLHQAGHRPDGTELKGTTRKHNVVAVTTLHSFAKKQKLIKIDVFGLLEKPHAARRDRVPTAEEFAAILRLASPAFLLMCTALAQSGARPGELCTATIADAIFDDRPRIELVEHKTARKTGKKRIITMGQHFKGTVRFAIGNRTEGPIFLSERGQGWSVGNLSSTFRKLRDKAGVKKDVVLYHFRHRFATEALRAGVPLGDVSLLLGHANIATTQIYLHRDATEATGGQDKVPDLPPLEPPQSDVPPKAA